MQIIGLHRQIRPETSRAKKTLLTLEFLAVHLLEKNGGPQFPHSEAISFQIPCSDQAEIDKYWEILIADGGQESQCGWLKDKFGISWQVVSSEMNKYLGGPNAAGAQRATQAMLGMKKIDLAAMKSAYENS